MANWIWRVVHQFVARRYGPGLSRNSLLNYLHRLGFVPKRPKKRLVKADERKRESLVTISKLNEQAWAEGKSPLIPLSRKGETLKKPQFEIVS